MSLVENINKRKKAVLAEVKRNLLLVLKHIKICKITGVKRKRNNAT